MEKYGKIDDQMLGSFIDGHLDAENSETIIKAMHEDPEIREQVYQLRRAKDLMKLAFGKASPPTAGKHKVNRTRRLFSVRIAASVAALVISFAAGILGHAYLQGQPGFPDQLFASASQLQSDTDNIILHISEPDPMEFITALEFAKNYLELHEAKGGRIEVVANAGGIDLLRKDVSPVAEEIIELIRNHDNVQFVACANAIRMLKRKGIEPTFIEGTHADETAMDYVIRRIQQGGWKYIKVDSLSEI